MVRDEAGLRGYVSTRSRPKPICSCLLLTIKLDVRTIFFSVPELQSPVDTSRRLDLQSPNFGHPHVQGPHRMHVQLKLSAITFLSLALCCRLVMGADLPPKLEKELTLAKEEYNDEFKAANDALSVACDKCVENIRKSSKLSGDEQAIAIGTLETEKTRFEKHGMIPLSQPMRASTVLYLKRIQKAEFVLAKVYDRAIQHHTKNKDDDDAKAILADKEAVLSSKKVIHLKRLDNGYEWELNSDGGGGSRTWSIDSKALVVKYHDEARAFTLTYTCYVQPSGAVFDCVAQDGGKFRAVLVEPE